MPECGKTLSMIVGSAHRGLHAEFCLQELIEP